MKAERDDDSTQELLIRRHPVNSVLWFQMGILRCVGLVLPEKVSLGCWLFMTFAALMLLGGGWFLAGLGMANIYLRLFGPGPGGTERPEASLLDVVNVSPLMATSLRAIVPLTIVFVLKRRTLFGLFNNINRLAILAIPDGVIRRYRARWKWQIAALTVYSIFVRAVTEPLAWSIQFSARKWTATKGNPFDPVPQLFPTWTAALLSEMFVTLPNLLSMQLSILLIGCALILETCLRQIQEGLQRERQWFLSCTSGSHASPLVNNVNKTPEYSHPERALQHMLHLHSSIVNTCQDVNDAFGLIFTVSYLCDFVGMVGLLTTWFLNTASVTFSDWHILYKLILTAHHAFCAGVLLIPLFRMHEKSLEIHEELFRYADASLNALQRDEGNKLRRILHLFLAKSKDQTIAVEGLHLVYATRQLFVATFTICASFIVVAKEFLQKPSSPEALMKSVLTANRTLH